MKIHLIVVFIIAVVFAGCKRDEPVTVFFAKGIIQDFPDCHDYLIKVTEGFSRMQQAGFVIEYIGDNKNDSLRYERKLWPGHRVLFAYRFISESERDPCINPPGGIPAGEVFILNIEKY